MGKSIKVLAIDDDPTQLELFRVICSTIADPAVDLTTVERAEDGFRIVETEPIDLVVTDHRLAGLTGLDVLRRVKKTNPLIAVVVVTAFESTQDALEVIRNGGDDYLIKPIRHVDIEHIMVRTAERLALVRENAELREEIEILFKTDFLIFESREMTDLLNVAARSAGSSATVLIRGESGTGKELIAQLIHYASDRKEGPFVTVNVAAFPETLVETELFGHRKGSFTGATEDRTGCFEAANGGTLFIDEIGDVTPAIQVELLRAMQSGQIRRVGDNQPISLDVRIIAATNRSLEQMMKDNRFRVDLYYRLNVIPLNVPALRDRRADIPPLVTHFIRRFGRKNHKEVKSVSHEAMAHLLKYDYPGNVRELENTIERAIILARGPVIQERDLLDAIRMISAGQPRRDAPVSSRPSEEEPALPAGGFDDALREFERNLLENALKECSGNQSAAARRLGIGERKLRSRLEVLGIANQFRRHD